MRRWISIFVSMYPGNGHEWGGALLADYGNVNWSDIHHYYVIVLTAGAYYSTSTNCSTGGYLSILARVITGHICVPANSNPSGKWLYTVSSNLPSLPALGSLVHPATDAAKMPKIVTNDSGDGVVFEGGANHI
jgi:hypothetical protein